MDMNTNTALFYTSRITSEIEKQPKRSKTQHYQPEHGSKVIEKVCLSLGA